MLRHGNSGMTGRPSAASNNRTEPNRPHQTRLVQSMSVHSQFLALTSDRETLRKAIEAAERDHSVVEQHLQELRAMQDQLVQETRKTKELLGGVHRQHAMLKDEKARLQRQMDDEQKDLDVCIDQADKNQKNEKQNQIGFYKDMAALNDNMETMLQKLEDSRLQQLVSVETIEYLRDIRHKSKTHAPEGFHKSFEEAVANFKDATFKLNREMEEQEQMKVRIKAFRAKTLDDSSDVSEEQLTALERAWENPSLMTPEIQDLNSRLIQKRYPHGAPSMYHKAGSDKPNHMDVFYGDQKSVDTVVTETEDPFQENGEYLQDDQSDPILDRAMNGQDNQFVYHDTEHGNSSNEMEDDNGMIEENGLERGENWQATGDNWAAQEAIM